MGKNACEFDTPIVLGLGPKGEVVDASGVVAAAAGVVVTAAFEGRGPM